jgi:hypothetical protein
MDGTFEVCWVYKNVARSTSMPYQIDVCTIARRHNTRIEERPAFFALSAFSRKYLKWLKLKLQPHWDSQCGVWNV